jgi:regulatory protein
LVDENVIRKARYRVIRWLSYRQRSRHEVSDYLARKGYPEAVIETVLAEMGNFGYVDDSRFADELLQVCVRRGYGPKRARWELRKRGLDEEIAIEKLAQYFDPDEDLARVREILDHRALLYKCEPDERWIRRQVAFLKRRGFQDTVIIKALQDYYPVSP